MELRFNSPKLTETIKHDNIQINKASLHKRKNPFRCLNCGGYEHARKVCPIAEEHCFKCGSKDHHYKRCKFKVVRVNLLDLNQEEESFEYQNPEENQPEEEEVSDQNILF
eukprot:snap_masked-scaffold_14-processed-gene-5.24-mRNA-1 protein AED:1.00 eAED:1.00 QI:0/-1/0/0/-1/1/1/0/109